MTRRELFLLSFAMPLFADSQQRLLSGYRLLYHLRFADARAEFLAWQREYPNDPMGFASEAASQLFEEFEQHGVLTTEFFLDDERLLGGILGSPNAARTRAFQAAAARVTTMAKRATDANSLLALTLCEGMYADYESIIQKEQIASLKHIRSAESFGKQLLQVSPQMGDGYMALGAANYILACLPSYKRAVLWFGGLQGDKQRGMDQLAEAARTGLYLAPYAKVMLALAMLREKRKAQAFTLATELTTQFPDSPLFARIRQGIGNTR
ncbi:MAG: hypothetical protein ABI995_03130 [Acidobacteriota bacterium]